MLYKRIAALLLVITAAATACSSGDDDATNTVQTEQRDTEDVSGPTEYPLTITNCGEEYTFEEPPSRVVIMSGGSYAEVSSMLALGLGDRIVANAQQLFLSDRPQLAKQAADLPTGGVDVGDMGMGDIPRETMLGLRPDFVLSTWGGGFASENGFATREELRQAGATTYVPEVTCAGDGAPGHEETVEDSYALLSDLGRIFDVGDHAEELIVRITYAPNPLAGRTAAAISFNTC